MKKLLTLGILGLSVASGWAQGTILFQNTGITFPGPTVDRRVYDVGGAPLTGTNYAAGLYYVEGADQNMGSPTSGTLALGLNNLSLAFFRVSTTASPGYWLNNAAVGNSRTLVGVTSGETATLQVRVWDITRFATYVEAVAGGGITMASCAWNYTVPPPGAPVDQSYMTGLRAFGPFPCPEPSTVALGVLGLASLLLFRRSRA